MSSNLDIPLLKPSLRDAAKLLATFREWWVQEFNRVLPDRLRRGLFGPGRKLLQIEKMGEEVTLRLVDVDDGSSFEMPPLTQTDCSAGWLDAFLSTHGLLREEVDVAVIMPDEQFFYRKLILPAEALKRLNEVVTRDLENKTSFRLDKIYHHFTIEPDADPAKITVLQWIIKRPFVEHALAELGLDREEVSQVCAKPTRDDSPSALIPLRQDTSETKRWYLTSIRTLVTGLAILSAGAVSAKFFQQQSVIGELDTQLATTGAKAREVRAHIDRLERKQSSIVRIRTAKYATPGLNDLLEWTTTLLPSHSWLSEFQLSQPDDKMGEQQINISGFSEGAASLVGLFDASPYFNDATLTSPISLDPVEARERFSMQMRVRKPRSEKSSTP